MAKPQVRIVHQGGPAQLMRVFVGDEQLLSVAKVELVLDANDHGSVSARLTIHDVDLDVVAELGAVQSESRGVAWSDVPPAGFVPASPGARVVSDGSGPEVQIPPGTAGYITPPVGP